MGGRGANAYERGNYNRMLDIRRIDGADYEKNKNGEQISIFANNSEQAREIDRLIFGDDYRTRGITQEDLNNAPVVVRTIIRTGNPFETMSSYYVFKDINTMNKKIRGEYGGFSQLGKRGQDYSIMSASGKGEYYLINNITAKNGRVWVDVNGGIVGGYFGFERNKRTKEVLGKTKKK